MYAHVFVCVAAMACLIYQTSKIQNRLCVLEVPPACRFQKVFYTPACVRHHRPRPRMICVPAANAVKALHSVSTQGHTLPGA